MSTLRSSLTLLTLLTPLSAMAQPQQAAPPARPPAPIAPAPEPTIKEPTLKPLAPPGQPPRQPSDPELRAGDPAPAIEVEKWVKGDPITKFEPGKVYIVEFWATWCPPCKEQVRHLTNLAHQYNDKVSVMAVSIWESSHPPEDNNLLARVEQFVKDQGDAMDYAVAYGGEPAQMAQSWLALNHQVSIPCAFVIGGKGTLLWSGHPTDLDTVIADVVSGKLDDKTALERSQADQQRQRKQRDLSNKMMNASRRFDYEAAMGFADQLAQLDPKNLLDASLNKFTFLVRAKGDQAAFDFIKPIADGPGKDSAGFLNAVALAIITDPKIQKPDLDLALRLAQRADELMKHDNAQVLDTLAHVHSARGDAAKAVAIQTFAVAVATQQSDPSLAELRAALDKFKESAGRK